MSTVNLRKNRKNLSIPNVATVNVNDADPVHRLLREGTAIVWIPRDVHDDPIHRLIEVFDLNRVEFVIEPVGVSGGVGGGVEVDFKMHLIFPKRFVVCYASNIIYIGTNVNSS